MSTTPQTATQARKLLNVSLWTAQGMIAFFFIWGAYMKLGTPSEEAAKMMPWVAMYPNLKVFTGLVDLLGGIGILLPALFGIKPRLSVLAAMGAVILQILAILFHVSRGETMVLPMNVLLLTLAGFVFWGRSKVRPF